MSFFDFLDDPAVKALLAGGAIAATGGAAAPALLAGEGAAAGAGGLLAAEGAAAAGAGAAASATPAAGLLADPLAAYMTTGGAESSIMGGGLTGAGGSSGAVGGGTFANTFGNAKNIASAIKPYGDAAGAAMQVKGLLSSPEQPHQQAQSSAPQMNNGQGAQSLAQLYQQGTQMSPEEQARLQRKTMWG